MNGYQQVYDVYVPFSISPTDNNVPHNLQDFIYEVADPHRRRRQIH